MRPARAIKMLLLTGWLGLPSAGWPDGNPRAAGGLARRPAMEGLRISNDRWPDSSALRLFAEDAIRLERARTEEEEARALYHWIARVMTIGGSPHEGSPRREAYVLDTLKILNVYGNHWCDGQARIYETMWRSLGRQARRLYIPMRHHTFVELWWRDTDGQGRWHALDVNNGWFVRNGQGWIASGGATVKMGELRLEALPSPPGSGEDALLSAVERLKSGTVSRRAEAIIEAGLRKQKAAVPALIRILNGEDEELRYWAADALGKIGDAQAAPALIAALRDPFEAVRMSASVALGDLKAKEAVPALSDLVSGKLPPGKGYALFVPVDVGAARWMAAQALGRIGDAKSVAVLAATILEADGDLGLYVATALGELGDRRAVDSLRKASNQDSVVYGSSLLVHVGSVQHQEIAGLGASSKM